MSYAVRTDVFEGPFDLLLRLITTEQVDVYEVSLSRIVDAYLAEVDRMSHLDLEVATEFLLIAATLVELKCRRLLPGREGLDLDEELAFLEERDLLLARLVECKTYASAGAALALLEEAASRSIPRRAGPDERFAELRPDVFAGVTPERLRRAAMAALAPKPDPRVEVDHILVDELTVAELVSTLAADLERRGPATFRELTAGLPSFHVIVHFLAVLELYKLGVVEIEQAETFGELVIEWTGSRNLALMTSAEVR